MEKLNTHYYDSKLLIDFPIPIIPDRIEFAKSMQALYTVLVPILTPGARNNFLAIAQGQGNYDNANNLYADQLLYACYLLLVNKNFDKDLLVQLAIQLDEMSSGMCPQGRTTRLYQVLYANRD